MLTAARSRLAVVRDGDAGLTLTELIVTTTLATIIGALSTYFFMISGRITTRAGDESFTSAQVRAAMTEATSVLQFADSPTTAGGSDRFLATTYYNKTTFGDPTEVTLYSNRTANRSATAQNGVLPMRGAPVQVDLRITGGTLVETIWGSAGPVSTVLLTNVVSGSGFTYCTAAPTNATTGACTTTTDPTAVASVVVTLVVNGLAGESVQTFTSAAGITSETGGQ